MEFKGQVKVIMHLNLLTADKDYFDCDMQDVVKVQGEHERLLHIQKVVKELPSPHFR